MADPAAKWVANSTQLSSWPVDHLPSRPTPTEQSSAANRGARNRLVTHAGRRRDLRGPPRNDEVPARAIHHDGNGYRQIQLTTDNESSVSANPYELADQHRPAIHPRSSPSQQVSRSPNRRQLANDDKVGYRKPPHFMHRSAQDVITSPDWSTANPPAMPRNA